MRLKFWPDREPHRALYTMRPARGSVWRLWARERQFWREVIKDGDRSPRYPDGDRYRAGDMILGVEKP